jgi:enamine deaminase RidA (YjgF/YER057c/UK114 family)
VGVDLDLAAARDAARLVALNLVTTIRRELGSLDAVGRIVKVLGMVNCAPGFRQTPAVIDGCSDVLVEIFGEDVGRHARSAVGMSELPFNIAVEIEMIVEIR